MREARSVEFPTSFGEPERFASRSIKVYLDESDVARLCVRHVHQDGDHLLVVALAVVAPRGLRVGVPIPLTVRHALLRRECLLKALVLV